MRLKRLQKLMVQLVHRTSISLIATGSLFIVGNSIVVGRTVVYLLQVKIFGKLLMAYLDHSRYQSPNVLASAAISSGVLEMSPSIF
jgi:hypothetical protein